MSINGTVRGSHVDPSPVGGPQNERSLAAGEPQHYLFSAMTSGLGVVFKPVNTSGSRALQGDTQVLRDRLLALRTPFQLALNGRDVWIGYPSPITAQERNALGYIGATGLLLLRPVLCRVPAFDRTRSPQPVGASTSGCTSPAVSGTTPKLDTAAANSLSQTPAADGEQRSQRVILPSLAQAAQRLLLGPAIVTKANAARANVGAHSALQLNLTSEAWTALRQKAKNSEVAIDVDGVVIGVFNVLPTTHSNAITLPWPKSAYMHEIMVEINSGPLPATLDPVLFSTFHSVWSGPDLRKPSNKVPTGASIETFARAVRWPAVAVTLIRRLRQSGARDVIVSKLGSNVIEADVLGRGFGSAQFRKMVGIFARVTGTVSLNQISTASLAFQ